MLLYYVTDRRQFPGDEAARRRALLAKIGEAARCGVDYIQLREKDLPIRELEALAREAVAIVRENRNSKLETRNSKLLINSRLDIALACGADGVHLPGGDIPASDARAAWDVVLRRADVLLETGNRKLETPPTTADWRLATPVIGVSCHSLAEVLAAESHGADFAVFGPVFEKEHRPGVGLAALREVCRRGVKPDPKTETVATGHMPVLALGGVTLENAQACVEAGAAGIAGIRLFQENDIPRVVEDWRGVNSKLET